MLWGTHDQDSQMLWTDLLAAHQRLCFPQLNFFIFSIFLADVVGYYSLYEIYVVVYQKYLQNNQKCV